MLDIADSLDRAGKLLNSGDGPASETIYRQIIAAQPNQPDAVHMLGILAIRNNDIHRGVELIRKSISLKPDALFYSNLGYVLTALEDFTGAVEACRHAVRLRPDMSEAYANLGNALKALENYPHALAAYQQAVDLKPDLAMLHMNKGVIHHAMGQYEQAIAAQRRAIALDPKLWQAWHHLERALEAAGNIDQAVATLELLVSNEPNPQLAHYDLAALGREAPPPMSPPEYIVDLFNSYAPIFEHHLTSTLGYRAPQYVLESLQECRSRIAQEDKKIDILDLGCGSGLGGDVFRPIAKSIVGVDMAPAMVKRCATRGVYNQVVLSSASDYLQDRSQQFDFILSTDLFIYIGDISVVMHRGAMALRPGGMMGISIETHDHPNADFVLLPTRRYAQSVSYMNRMASENGLIELKSSIIPLRREGNGWIMGRIFILAKP